MGHINTNTGVAEKPKLRVSARIPQNEGWKRTIRALDKDGDGVPSGLLPSLDVATSLLCRNGEQLVGPVACGLDNQFRTVVTRGLGLRGHGR